MKAISLSAPYATAVMMGLKLFETRQWSTAYRGPILMHQSLSKKYQPFFDVIPADVALKVKYPKWEDLPLGVVLGYVNIVGMARTQDIKDYLCNMELNFGDYSPNRWAWQLKDPVVFDEPIPYKGALSIWQFPDEILKERGIYNPSLIINR